MTFKRRRLHAGGALFCAILICMRSSASGGYVGLLVFLIGVAIMVYLYVQFSPLAPSPGSGTTTPEAVQAIDAAKNVKLLIEQRDAASIQQQ